MTVEVLKNKIEVVEKDTDKLTEDLEHVRDKVNEIDKKVATIETEQRNQSKALDGIQKTLKWLLAIVAAPVAAAVANFLIKGGFSI